MKRICLSFICLGLIGDAFASGSQWILWNPISYQPVIRVPPSINEDTREMKIDFNYPAFNGLMQAALVVHKGRPGSGGQREKYNWVIGPKTFAYEINGKFVKFTYQGTNVYRGQPDNIFAYPSLGGVDENYGVGFNYVTGQYTPAISNINMPANYLQLSYAVNVPSSIPAGHYFISIPSIKVGFEEHKWWGAADSTSPATVGREIWARMPTKDLSTELIINNKCFFSVNNLNIEHGDIKPEKNISKHPATVNIRCDRTADVSLTLKGNKNENIAECGSGECKVEFDSSGSDVKTVKYNGFVGSVDKKIYSTFEPYRPAKEGAFEGYAILVVDIT